MKIRSVLTVSVLLLVGVGCSPISVSHDYDPQANFSALKTFAWVAFPQNVEINQLTVRRIKSAVSNELVAKGLQESSSNPDILIASLLEKPVIVPRTASRQRLIEKYNSIGETYHFEDARELKDKIVKILLNEQVYVNHLDDSI